MKKENVRKIKKYGLAYIAIFIFIAVTPFLATPVAKLFDWVTLTWYKGAVGKLRPFFRELFTCIFWVIEFSTIFFLNRKKERKTANEGGRYPFMALESELAVSSDSKKQATVLPLRNVVFLFFITALCILVLSLQIDFQVKPFYDFGEKINPMSIYIQCGVLVRNLLKCVWITWLLRVSYRLSEQAAFCFNARKSTMLAWTGTVMLTLCYGIFDVLITANPFAWTYVLFYLAFVGVYYFTEKQEIKSFLLIAFIYIF